MKKIHVSCNDISSPLDSLRSESGMLIIKRKFIANYAKIKSFMHPRTYNVSVQLFYTFIIRALSLLTNFALVPMTMSYVNIQSYGIWLVLSSIILWLSIFDIGLGHGLRNKLTEALAAGDFSLAKIYTSTAYGLIICISLCIWLVFLVINPLIDWTSVLNVSVVSLDQLSFLVLILVCFFCLQFVLRLITSVLMANQKPSFPALINLVANIIILLLLAVTGGSEEQNLIQLALIYSFPVIILLLIATLLLFNSSYKAYRPSLFHFRFKYARDIGGLGVKFFLLQIEVLILFQLTNYLIIYFFGSEAVVQYNVAYKYFMVIQLVAAVIMNTYWSSITKAMVQNDYEWVEGVITTLVKLFLVLLPLSYVMLFFADEFYGFWIGDEVQVPFLMSVFIYIWVVIEAWNAIFEYFLNSISKIFVMVVIGISTALLYLPLSFFIVNVLHFGPEGLVLAVIICRLFSSIILPIQYDLLINRKARGLWNK